MNISAAEFTPPIPPPPTSPLELAADQLGWPRSVLAHLVGLSGGNDDRQGTEFACAEWVERLRRDVISREVTRRTTRPPIGPASARELTAKDAFVRVSAASLRTAASGYSGGPALLLGKTGVGKTLTAMLMARTAATTREQQRLNACRLENLADECLRRTRSNHVAWISCSELPRLAVSQPFGAEHEAVQHAKTAPLTVLDDLTWGANDKALLEIIAHRYDHGLPTISTAGATRAELVTRFGDAAVRRLLECRGVKGLLVEAF